MNLSIVKSITIPEGNVTAFSIGGVKVWGGGSSGDEPAELLSWEGVAYHINKGTYKDVYAIGDMVPLDLGSQGLINMQIAAFDTDSLADGSGTAAISWVAKEVLNTKHNMNPSLEGTSGAYTEGTGTIGGWEKCEMRTYLQNTIKPLIPADVAALIEAVTKSQPAYPTSGSEFTQTTVDEVWLPAYSEVFSAGIYTGLFKANSDRVKYQHNGTTRRQWWLRSISGQTKFHCVGTSGTNSPQMTSSTQYVCLGFCTGRTPT